MALTKCPDCGREVSDQATACIQCGRPIKPASQPEVSVAPQTVKAGRQRSKLRNDLGSAIALVGAIVATVVGFGSGSLWVGFIVFMVFLGFGIWVAYGW